MSSIARRLSARRTTRRRRACVGAFCVLRAFRVEEERFFFVSSLAPSERERETIRFDLNRFALFFSLSLFLSVSLSFSRRRRRRRRRRRTLDADAWLPSIGTGVVIGQHFRRDVLRQLRTVDHRSASEGRKEERRSRRTGVCVMFVPILFFPSSFLAACVRSSAGRLTRSLRSLFTIAYSKRQRQILRLARISLVRIHTTIFLTFFRVCLFATMGRRRR